MSENGNFKPFSRLVHGDHFSYRGEVATFVEYTDRSNTICGMEYRQAVVVNGDNEPVRWWIPQGMAGTVFPSVY